jgi:nicotinate-nucleotide pyrophosphorylase (carboxylating)
MPEPLDPESYRPLIRRALAEDIGAGDITTSATVPLALQAEAAIVAKRPCVLAGLAIAEGVFAAVDSTIGWTPVRSDGDRCDAGTTVARLRGPARSLLTAERTALNFLQHLSGIATLTREFVDAAGGRLSILDTRKTIPTLRALAKYAVRCGGGANHRVSLDDGILIKDNHIRIAGGIEPAVRRMRAAWPGRAIEVETQSVEEVEAALAAGVDIIMLDNLDDGVVAAAIRRIAGRARVELSGNMTVDRVRRLAASGADCVSIGALTHSAPAADLSLDIETVASGPVAVDGP